MLRHRRLTISPFSPRSPFSPWKIKKQLNLKLCLTLEFWIYLKVCLTCLYKTTKLSNKSQNAFLPSSPTVPGTRRFLGSQEVLGVPLILSLHRYLADRASPANHQLIKSAISHFFYKKKIIYNFMNKKCTICRTYRQTCNSRWALQDRTEDNVSL